MEQREIKHLLNTLVIKTPCSQKWENMTGDEKVRLCGECNLNVHNLSAMTDFEAASVLKRRETERVCVYAYRRKDGSVITDNCPKQLRKLRTKIKATAAAVVITLCYAVGLSARASGGLVGAHVDTAFGQANEVGTMGEYGYDTARNISNWLTVAVAAIVWFVPVNKTKKRSIKKLILETLALACIPLGVHLVGAFFINNFGGLGGGF